MTEALLLLLQAAAYSGAEVCAQCHPKQARTQAASEHARAVAAAGSHGLQGAFGERRTMRRGPYEFAWDGSTVRAADDTNYVDVTFDWAFGAGMQAITFVTRADAARYIEFAFSYYPAIKGWGLTPGQHGLKPANLGEALGLYYPALDAKAGIVGCFECHSTGPPEIGEASTIVPRESGVRCEACHGPGGTHALSGGKQPIKNPGSLDARRMNRECGRCHRPPGGDLDWSFAWNVRHHPPYLEQSRCFESGALRCTSCHDPHAPLARSGYNEKCLGCHQVTAAKRSTNCVDCHMPRVSPEPPLRFTNHRIGVYGDGSRLKPR